MAENQDIEQIIIDLFEMSRKLTEFKNDNNKLLDEINKMDKDDSLLFDFYQKYSKVRGLRYHIVNEISQGINITFEDIERKKEEINSEFPNRNVFRNWSNFAILFELYYKKYRASVNEKLRKLHTFLRDQLKLNFNKTESIKGFDWNQQFGTTGCWVALIPEYLRDHKESVQLFIAINYNDSPNKIKYGLYYGDSLGLKEKNDLNHIEDIAQLSINEIVSYLKSLIPAYIEANEEIYDLEIDDKKKKLEIITKDIDLSILETVFDEIPLYFDDRERIKNEILACLRSNKNIIFFGPPGTGKTQLAEIICKKVVKHNYNIHGYIFTTATSDWTTFETIGGYMPSMEGQNLEFKPGLFLQCFRNNQGDPINKWLIIDEINRADIDKAFGQLFSVLSGNKVDLPYLKDEKEISILPTKTKDFKEESKIWDKNVYYVTNMWRLIATMNTYDKASLYEMSYAFMRRFAFIHIDVPDISENIIEKICTFSKWDVDINKLKEKFNNLENLWVIINNYRKIGPAIIYDILQYLEKHPNPNKGLTSSIIHFVLPQFEGLDKLLLKECIQKIENTVEEIDGNLLNKVVFDMFGIKI